MSYARLVREIIEAYHLDFSVVASWTMEQLYIAVVEKERLPKTLKSGTVSIPYSQAIAAGLVRQPANVHPDATDGGETMEQRMDRIYREHMEKTRPNVPGIAMREADAVIPQPEEAGRRRRRRRRGGAD